MRFIALLAVVLIASSSFADTHRSLVRQSGIRPRSIGSAEGVGMSSRSPADAIRNCCFWGSRTPVSIQTSQRGGRYYAVVRYR